MSNDAQKVQDAMLAIHSLWGSPALIAVILALLYQQVGWATFVGLGVMLMLVPLTGLIAGERAAPRCAAPAGALPLLLPGCCCRVRAVCCCAL
jgi:hypothetical protein